MNRIILRETITAHFIFSALLTLILPLDVNSEEIRIGLLAEQTGDFARTGKDCMDGFERARKLNTKDDIIGDTSLKYIIGDSLGAAGPGLSEFKRMTEAGGASVVILTRSTVALSINPISKAKKIPVLVVAAHPAITADNEYAFRFYPNAIDEGIAISKHALSLGLRAATVTTDDDFNLAVKKSFTNNFSQNGGQIVFEETVLPAEINFNTVVTKIRSKYADFVLSNLNPQQTGIFIKKLREAGIKSPVVSNFYLGLPDVQKVAGESAKGSAYIQIKSETSAIEFACFAALSGLIQSLNNAERPLSSLSVFQSLNNLREVELGSRKIEIINREAKIPLVVKTVQ